MVLRQMSDDLRTVFVLFEIEGMTVPEVAEVVGIPLGTAASRLRRAREKFRKVVRAITGIELARPLPGRPAEIRAPLAVAAPAS